MKKARNFKGLKRGLLRGDIQKIADSAGVTTRMVHLVCSGERRNVVVLGAIIDQVEVNKVQIEAEIALEQKAVQLSMTFAGADA